MIAPFVLWRGIGNSILNRENVQFPWLWSLSLIPLLLLTLRPLLLLTWRLSMRLVEMSLTRRFQVPLLEFLRGSISRAAIPTYSLALHSSFLRFHLLTLGLNHNGPIHQCSEVKIHNSPQLQLKFIIQSFQKASLFLSIINHLS